MLFDVEITPPARRDLVEIFDWLAERSPQGAASWLDAAQRAIERLKTIATKHPIDPRSSRLKIEFRIHTFQTPSGRRYQIVYVVDIAAELVRILRVRGPGRRSVRRRDLS